MTAEEPSIASKEDLNAELKSIFQRAHANGINVEGGWECRNGANRPDWDVIVTEVQKTEESE